MTDNQIVRKLVQLQVLEEQPIPIQSMYKYGKQTERTAGSPGRPSCVETIFMTSRRVQQDLVKSALFFCRWSFGETFTKPVSSQPVNQFGTWWKFVVIHSALDLESVTCTLICDPKNEESKTSCMTHLLECEIGVKIKIEVIIVGATISQGNAKPGNLLLSFHLILTITQWARYYSFYLSGEKMTQKVSVTFPRSHNSYAADGAWKLSLLFVSNGCQLTILETL